MAGTAAGAAKARERLRLRRAAGLDTGPRCGRLAVPVEDERAVIDAALDRMAMDAAAERARLAPQRRRWAEMDRAAAARAYGPPPPAPEPPRPAAADHEADPFLRGLRL